MAQIGRSEITSIFAGIAGYGDGIGSLGNKEKVVFETVFVDITCTIANDSANALAGALLTQPGICIIGGTGSIGFREGTDGRMVTCGGWCYALFGDEGSGYWIARRMLSAFTRQSDGRESRTLLYEALIRDLQLETAADIISIVEEDWKLDRTRIAGLARYCAAYAEQGDVCCLEILRQAAGELAAIAIALSKDNPDGKKLPVSYSDGVFRMGALVLDPLEEILSASGPRLVHPQLQPDCGAVLLAMKTVGALSPAAIKRLVLREEENKNGIYSLRSTF